METDVEKLLDTFGAPREEANFDGCFGDPMTIKG